jgi:hypothetical protein
VAVAGGDGVTSLVASSLGGRICGYLKRKLKGATHGVWQQWEGCLAPGWPILKPIGGRGMVSHHAGVLQYMCSATCDAVALLKAKQKQAEKTARTHLRKQVVLKSTVMPIDLSVWHNCAAS